MSELDASLLLRATGPGAWAAHSDPRHEANNGMFGGWTAAILLKSALDDPRANGATPTAMTVNYIDRLPPNCDLDLRVIPAGGGRSLTFWNVDMRIAGQVASIAQASVLLAHRRETIGVSNVAMPSVPAPEEVPPGSGRMPGPHGASMEMRFIEGYPPFDRSDARSTAWVRETSARGVDYLQLAFLADAYPPRIFYAGATPRPTTTVTMSVYFYATTAQLQAVGDDFVLVEAMGTRGESGAMGQQARLWSRAGALLATTEQIHWYR